MLWTNQCDLLHKGRITTEAYEITGLANPNSAAQIKGWLGDQGIEADSLNKKAVKDLIEETDGEVYELLKLRQEMAKTSVKKYEAIERSVTRDGRVHGLFQFYGANRTGRFAGRLVQVQNLPQNHLPDLDLARSLVREGRLEDIDLLYDSLPGVLSELIRTAFVPKQGTRFIVADFSAIEARVLAWLSGETWRLDVFQSHGKIYEASASAMFKVPLDEIGKGSPLRQKGKVAELACIAEGELVLTDLGLVPIERITKEHKLWDGNEWVTHEGVIYKGKREVIEYEGLRATRDHLVWTEGKQRLIQFGEAASSSAHLLQTGNGRKPIRMGENNKSGKEMEQTLEPLLCINPVCKLQKYSMDRFRELKNRKIKGLSKLFSTKASTPLVIQEIICSEESMPEPTESSLSQIWCKRDRVQIRIGIRRRSLDSIKCAECEKRNGTGSYQQQWSLRNRKYKVRRKMDKSRESSAYCYKPMGTKLLAICKGCRNEKAKFRNEQRSDYKRRNECGCLEKKELAVNRSKTRVYDIRNAGRNHRFTVSGKLVHNCGYGGSIGALKAMGALEMGVAEGELQGLITNWRAANPHITKFWWEVDAAALEAVKEKTTKRVGKIEFQYRSGILFVTLPSGRKLSYIKPRIETNKFGRDGLTYEGIGESRKWMRIETYGPKLVENIVQAASRDLLTEAMLRLRNSGFDIVMHVHDEIVLEVEKDRSSVKEICELMAKAPEWATGLPLRADGYECSYYKKD